jgi:hypothetical protein
MTGANAENYSELVAIYTYIVTPHYCIYCEQRWHLVFLTAVVDLLYEEVNGGLLLEARLGCCKK